MAKTAIGLDIGTAAVRAAEVQLGRGDPVLLRFGQVALEPGAVVAGEVVDPPTVAAAIRRLWREAGFKGKRVVTGIAGQRIVARTTELPALPDAEMRSSLPFQVQELIPIPLEEAILDYQVLEPVVAEDGSARTKVLIVAAHRDVVRSLLATLSGAGLGVERVDLIPFALIRALHEADFAELGDAADGATAEAIVDIGGGVTNVVVHEHGVPKFIRSVANGGFELTDAIATDLDVPYAEAEALKRRTDDDGAVAQARQVTRAALAPLLEEVRTSLDFWQAQHPDDVLRRIVLTGGTTRLDDLAARLELLAGVPVVEGRPFARVGTAKSGLEPDSIAAAERVAAVAVGLALSGEALAGGARRISLVPAEIGEQRRARRHASVAAGGVAAFAALLMGIYALRSGQVSEAEADAVAAEERTAQLQAELAQLRDVETLEADIAARRGRVTAVLAGDIAWGRLVQEVAAVLPNDVWLTQFSGSRGSGVETGQVSFGGMGFDQTSTARWILRVSELDALTGLWVPSSSRTAAASGRTLVTFSSTAAIAPAAQSSRLARYTGDVG